MAKVVLDMAMSLDGFICGPNDDDGGLHDYYFSPSSQTAVVIQEGIQTTGAIIMGRRTYDIGAKLDGFADNPYQVPTFVLSSSVPQKLAKGAEAFHFVSNGIESVLKQAQGAAGDRDVVVGGGANAAEQFINAELIDEIQIHLVPVLLGDGKHLWSHILPKYRKLDPLKVIDAPDAIHLRFRVVK